MKYGCVVYFLIFAVYASSTACLGSRAGAVSSAAGTTGARRPQAIVNSVSFGHTKRFIKRLLCYARRVGILTQFDAKHAAYRFTRLEGTRCTPAKERRAFHPWA